MQLKEKTGVITGAARGLGRALATELANANMRLVLTDINHDELVALADELHATAITGDVRNAEDMERVAATAAKSNQFVLWINNAGCWLAHQPLQTVDMHDARRVFDVNVFGTINGSRAALPHFYQRGAGAIVNIISIRARQMLPERTIYTASKCAVDGFTQSLRLEAKARGTQVIGIYPGPMKTAIFGDIRQANYEAFMDPQSVAEQIVANLLTDAPCDELIIP